MAKINDIVRFLNSTGGGRVVRVDGQMLYVEDQDGFEVPALAKECVVVGEYTPAPPKKPGQEAKTAGATRPQQQTAPKTVAEEDLDIEETEYGDKLNVVLAFEPSDLKSLEKSTFDCVLVNDSNFYLNFIFATRPEDSQQWTVRRTGVLEPNLLLTLEEFQGSDFATFDRINIQFVAYKADKPFLLKRPVSVIHKLDATKLFKLHCFHPNPYFDGQVIALDIVKDDEPYRITKPDPRQLETAMRQKRQVDRHLVRPVVKRAEQRRQGEAIVVDLHIDELIDNTRGLSAADMLNLQVDEFRRVMDANLNNKGQKIIFIHGKGEGVLKQAITKELNYRYKTHQVEDAPFRDFGAGATMVIIR